jgi:hypothetical protein
MVLSTDPEYLTREALRTKHDARARTGAQTAPPTKRIQSAIAATRV